MAALRTCFAMLGLLFVSLLSLSYRVAADEPKEELAKIIVLQKPEHCERMTKKHDVLLMHYTGTLTETGVKFDSSYDRGSPFEFQLGVGQVVPGWEKGLLDMCVGEKRKLIVPPHLAYGDVGAGKMVPPKASLTFEMELIEVKDGPTPPNVFKQIDTNGDSLLSREEVTVYMNEQQRKADPMSRKVSPEQLEVTLTQIFNHEDKNKDGVISHEEFSGPKHDEL